MSTNVPEAAAAMRERMAFIRQHQRGLIRPEAELERTIQRNGNELNINFAETVATLETQQQNAAAFMDTRISQMEESSDQEIRNAEALLAELEDKRSKLEKENQGHTEQLQVLNAEISKRKQDREQQLADLSARKVLYSKQARQSDANKKLLQIQDAGIKYYAGNNNG